MNIGSWFSFLFAPNHCFSKVYLLSNPLKVHYNGFPRYSKMGRKLYCTNHYARIPEIRISIGQVKIGHWSNVSLNAKDSHYCTPISSSKV